VKGAIESKLAELEMVLEGRKASSDYKKKRENYILSKRI